jgi:fructosamine-3-kinase
LSGSEGELQAALARALGRRVRRLRSLSGGDINLAFEAALEDGTQVFVKTHPRAPAGMYQAEARGLAWLGEAGALRVPSVIAVSEEGAAPSFLVLEYLASGRARPGFDEELGRGLAALHRAGAPSFGFETSNFIGSLPQSNRSHATFAEFFRDERLLPQLELAKRSGRASSALVKGFERLSTRLADLVGPPEPPARLHGDLWSGNLHVGPAGEPCLIDPAAYGGHRELDLAMMRLFGGFGPRVFAAYEEALPLAPGAAERVPLFQLYPLMVHLNLFGGGYAASVEAALARYVAPR